MFPKDFELPTFEELKCEEVELSTPALKAGAFHLGKYCETVNNEYMLCHNEEKDPRKCLNEGKMVTACSLEFFRAVKKTCLEEFNQYSRCLTRSGREYDYQVCRKTQSVLDKCMVDKMGLERPGYGYFCEAKVHQTSRPKPEGYKSPEFPDRPQPLPSEPPTRPSRYTGRQMLGST